MKQTTKRKLNQLAALIASSYAPEIVEVEKFLTIAKNMAEKNDINLHWVTIKSYEPYLVKAVKEKFLNDPLNYILEGDVDEPTTPQNNVVSGVVNIETPIGFRVVLNGDSVKIIHPDGREELFVPLKPAPEKYLGLFDYSEGKKIVIQRGKYQGCVITEIESVLKYFGNLKMVLGWIDYQLAPERTNKLHFVEAVERDIRCLKNFKSFIQRKMGK